MLHTQERLQPRNPVFSYASWHWPTKSKHRPTCFPLTAMITWFHGTVARIEVKNALFGPLELPSKTNLKTFFFSPGFYGFSTGSYGLEKASFWKCGALRVTTGFIRFTTVFLRILNSTPQKKKHNFPSWKTNLALRPLNSENNVDFLCKFVFRLKCVEGWIFWNVPLRDLERMFFSHNHHFLMGCEAEGFEGKLQQPTQLVSHAYFDICIGRSCHVMPSLTMLPEFRW